MAALQKFKRFDLPLPSPNIYTYMTPTATPTTATMFWTGTSHPPNRPILPLVSTFPSLRRSLGCESRYLHRRTESSRHAQPDGLQQGVVARPWHVRTGTRDTRPWPRQGNTTRKKHSSQNRERIRAKYKSNRQQFQPPPLGFTLFPCTDTPPLPHARKPRRHNCQSRVCWWQKPITVAMYGIIAPFCFLRGKACKKLK